MISKIIKNEKNELRIEIENPTIVELLRKIIVGDSNVTFVAWRREHPTKNPVLTIKTEGKTAKKALLESIERIQKINSSILDEFNIAVKK